MHSIQIEWLLNFHFDNQIDQEHVYQNTVDHVKNLIKLPRICC